ncbi:hypothetical protein KIP88_43380 [Bradyrhizobium sp. SRL28]|uniref:cysteine rich repeat-containing protein n=1 Tax=Bradyrhizobium sp. SRL28 TaxID=2836178 RepID=UPI001BDE49EE|nr:cysteine rich repeat-containing protein [Bradyrhizobium sp. SRL28]MBT1517187.1 hypothetical protein [Bradyrhizobium sp. SRL28]
MYRNSIRVIGVALVVFAVGGSGASFAQGSMQQQNACRPDVFRLCGSYIPNVGEIVACLKDNEARLSEPCHEVMFPDQGGRETYSRATQLRSGDQ